MSCQVNGKFNQYLVPYCSRLRTSRQDVNKLKEKKCSIIAVREKSISRENCLDSFDI